MTVMLEIRKANGIVWCRCDSRCYESILPDCSCVCQGENHGVGLEVAINNTHHHYERWIREYVKRFDLHDQEIVVGWLVLKQLQLPLSGIE